MHNSSLLCHKIGPIKFHSDSVHVACISGIHGNVHWKKKKDEYTCTRIAIRVRIVHVYPWVRTRVPTRVGSRPTPYRYSSRYCNSTFSCFLIAHSFGFVQLASGTHCCTTKHCHSHSRWRRIGLVVERLTCGWTRLEAVSTEATANRKWHKIFLHTHTHTHNKKNACRLATGSIVADPPGYQLRTQRDELCVLTITITFSTRILDYWE